MKNENPEMPLKSSSDVLRELANHKNLKKTLSYQSIAQLLGERAFGVMILFFTLPSLLPISVMPGISFIFSIPIVVFALEMIRGRKSFWLPKRLAKKRISHKKVAKIINAVLHSIVKLEHYSKPRWAFMTRRTGEIINGIVIVCVAFLLMLPIPFSNFILGFLLVLFSIGLIEEDGLLIMIGYGLFLLYATFLSFVTLKALEVFFFVKELM